jgi:iron(III) transport system substrate-binding protein
VNALDPEETMTQLRFSRRDLLKASTVVAAGAFSTRVKAAAEPEAITPVLIEAAKKEGKLAFYTAMDLPIAEKFGKTFEAKFPGVTVRVERSGAERVFQRIGQEMESRIYACDVVNTADGAHMIVWKRNNWLAPHLPEEVAQHYPAQYYDPDGMWLTTRVWLSSLGYNTNLVKAEDAPRSFADLLDPKWMGKMVKGHPAYSGTIMTATFQIVREFGWGYLEKLARQKVMQVQSSTDPPKKLALGERAVMADGNDYNLIQLKEAGQPVEVVYPTRPIPMPRGCSRAGCIRSRPSSSWSISPASIPSIPWSRRSPARVSSTRSSCGRMIPPGSRKWARRSRRAMRRYSRCDRR